MDPSPLASFIKKNPAFGILLRHVADHKARFDSAMHLFEMLNKYNMVKNQIVSDDCKVFCDNKIRKALEEFIASNPPDMMPLKIIRIHKRIPPSFHLGHFDSIHRDFLKKFSSISLFQNKFNIRVEVDIRLKVFDSEKAITLCEALVNHGIDLINFVFDFPALTKDSAFSFISNMKRFCMDPILKSEKIRLVNLPFCFTPEAKYRLLYRPILGALKGRVGLQRDLIEELKEKEFTYLKPCEMCRCKIPCYRYTNIRRFPGYSPFLYPKNQSTVAFLGGSLRKEEPYGNNDIVYTTPVQQGDMFMTILEGFKNILIIDGYFYNEFPCTTFEVLLALEEGRNVFGASSIGALRAVELDHYGMVGIGYVYHYLKNKRIKPYHVVAQIYDDNDQPLSAPLIHIIYFLKSALKAGIIKRNEFAESFHAANNIHFARFTFQHFFKHLESSKTLPQNIIERIKNYFFLMGEDRFNVKRKDALCLLRSFRSIIAKRSSDYVAKIFKLAKKKYLETLHGKYALDHDLTLPPNWSKPLGREVKRGLQNTKNIRELSPKDTCRLASIYFKGLDIVIADVSKYEQLNNVTINIFFIPFYFLNYPVSCSNGMGCNIVEALACAYMECLERIPLDNIDAASLPRKRINKNKIYPFGRIPQFYNSRRSLHQKRAVIKKYGYAKVTNILNNRNFYIPKFATFFKSSGTDGNASGNTYAESILYGVYELIERDVCRIYGSTGYDLKSQLLIDSKKIKDARCLALIKELESLGCRIFLFNLINIYEVPCIQCQVFDLNTKVIKHGGTVARMDYDSALFESLFEAYMQYMTDFVGSRDDYVAIQKDTFLFRRLYPLLCNSKHTEKDSLATKFDCVNDEFAMLIKKMRAAGVKDIFVANISPKKKYFLKNIKVIIPGLELHAIFPYKRSSLYKEKLENTISKVRAYLENP